MVALVRCLLMAAIWLVSPAPAEAGTIRVFAAASLADAIAEVARTYRAAKGQRITAVHASSSTLARQIEAGARADIYLSADEAWMDYLQSRGLIDRQSRRMLLRNKLVVVVPKPVRAAFNTGSGSDRGLAWLTKIGPGRFAVGDPAHVPAGRYARTALEQLGLWQDVRGRLAAAPDTRAALALVERGEVVAGFVYLTDAMASENVSVAARFPDNSEPAISYPIAMDEGRPKCCRPRRLRLHDRGSREGDLQAPWVRSSMSVFQFGSVELETLWLSLQIALTASAINVLPAIAAAWLLNRSGVVWRTLLNVLVHAPLVLPAVVIGYLLLLTFGVRGPIGAWLDDTFGIRLVFTTAGAVVAAAVMSFPLMVRAVRLALDVIDPGLEFAARSLGATRLDAFFTITLPLMLPGIFAGFVDGVRRQSRGIRCDDHVRLERRRRNAHSAAGDLHCHPVARW